MLSIVLATVLAQSAQCKTAYGAVVCGFDCVAAYGKVRCATTPAGACEAAYGQVTCFDPPTGFDASGALVKASCTSAFGVTACGYGCVAAYGQVRCAQTPLGVCRALQGRIECFDPQALGRLGWRAPAVAVPGECKNAYGSVVCGYHCVAAYGQVRCARTPLGACHAAYGEVKCFDPPAGEGDFRIPAECRSAFGQTACGYGCVAAAGQVRCAQTPLGACQAASGDVVCFDP
ncbi:MAG: hypothetical protein INH41_08865 [Myxococcaceae bacterium]|jgi:hypothetical protein|nr:hypothetical protein [Myxococcaceae bacterium]MCA3012495.1 hypothetical protein [Myxococcaceae bacterium]